MTGRERGASSIVTVVLLTPMMLVLVAFAVFAGRVSGARQDVVSASRDAARAASLRQFPSSAVADANAAAEVTLSARGVSCVSSSVVVNTSRFEAGGQVSVTVSCTVSAADLVGFWTPGNKTISETSVATIDRYRGGAP